MSLTIINADGTSPVHPEYVGRTKQVSVKITFDSSYPTGGEVLSPADLSLIQIDAIICNGTTTVGRLVAPILASGVWKLKVYDAVVTEEANATDLSADSVVALVIGK